MKPISHLLLLLAVTTLSACLGGPRRDTLDTSPGTALEQAEQLILVLAPDWDAPQATLYRFVRDAHGWQPMAEGIAVNLGRNGSAWGLGLHPPQPASQAPIKREGDGRSPAGIFRIGTAFGYAEHAQTGLPYMAMRATHYCMDVPDSPFYNRIIDANEAGADAVQGSTEPMRLDLHNDGDARYTQGFVIAHNPSNTPQAGSCIFAHLWRDADTATAGCTAMPGAQMQALLAWLDADREPLFVLLPQAEYQRLRTPWGLPDVGAAP